VRRISGTIAIVVFFVLAAIGTACGVRPLRCGLRALAGAAVLYVAVTLAGEVLIRIFADAATRALINKTRRDDYGR